MTMAGTAEIQALAGTGTDLAALKGAPKEEPDAIDEAAAAIEALESGGAATDDDDAPENEANDTAETDDEEDEDEDPAPKPKAKAKPKGTTKPNEDYAKDAESDDDEAEADDEDADEIDDLAEDDDEDENEAPAPEAKDKKAKAEPSSDPFDAEPLSDEDLKELEEDLGPVAKAKVQKILEAGKQTRAVLKQVAIGLMAMQRERHITDATTATTYFENKVQEGYADLIGKPGQQNKKQAALWGRIVTEAVKIRSRALEDKEAPKLVSLNDALEASRRRVFKKLGLKEPEKKTVRREMGASLKDKHRTLDLPPRSGARPKVANSGDELDAAAREIENIMKATSTK